MRVRYVALGHVVVGIYKNGQLFQQLSSLMKLREIIIFDTYTSIFVPFVQENSIYFVY